MKKFLCVFVGLIFSLLLFVPSASASSTYDLSDTSKYNLRFDGAAASDVLANGSTRGATVIADLNNNGLNDIIVPAGDADPSSTTDAGSVYIIYDSLISSLTGTGNNVDMSDTTKWNIRFDGATAGDLLGLGSVFVADIDGNGKNDLVLGARKTDYNSRSNSGSFYIIYDSVFNSLSGTGNVVSLSDATKWNVRFDGAAAGDDFGYSGFAARDIDGDGKLDLFVPAISADQNSRTNSGSLYVFKGSLISAYTGTGNTVDVATATNFNIRYDGSVAGANLGYGGVRFKDVNNNGTADLIVSESAGTFNSRTGSGAIDVIFDSLYASYSGTGNVVDLNTSTTYNLRFWGASASDALGVYDTFTAADLDNNGINDLILGARLTDYNSRSNSGSIYLIFDSILLTYSGTGNNIDLATSSNFNVRYDGPTSPSALGGSADTTLIDYNGDGKIDLVVGAQGSGYNSRSTSGSVYVIYNSQFASASGTGNLIDLSDTTKFNIRYDGATAVDALSYSSLRTADVNNDGTYDVLFGASTDYNSRTNSGSLYVIYNFPHTISVNSFTTASGSSAGVSGSVSVASGSITSLSGVQVLLDSGSPSSSSWKECSASDGSFNSTSENFNCTVDISSLSSGTPHAIYVRAYDSNTSYTGQVKYGSFTFYKDYQPQTSTDCPANFKYCIHGGKNLKSPEVVVNGGNGILGSAGKAILNKTANRDDVFVTISPVKTQSLPTLSLGLFSNITGRIPYPWEKGLNTVSEIMNFDSVSAFNGYPIIKTDNPFVIQLTYDKTKLPLGFNPKDLKISFFDRQTNNWKILPKPMVVNDTSQTIASTTNDFTLYAVTDSPQTILPLDTAPKLATDSGQTKEEKSPEATPLPDRTKDQPKTKLKTCVLWWCW